MTDAERRAEMEAEICEELIRLRGLGSQNRLCSAKILLISLNTFGAEVAKNIILAGVKSVTFLDHRSVSKEDSSQFLSIKDDIGKNRATASLEKAQKLNPTVAVTADESNVDDKSDAFYGNYDIVCASECTITQLVKINAACRQHNVKFFAGDTWGLFGYVFADLNDYEYTEDVVQTKEEASPESTEPSSSEENFKSAVNTVRRTESFVPFEKTLNIEGLHGDTYSDMYYVMQILLTYRGKYGRDPLCTDQDVEEFSDVAVAYMEEHDLGEDVENELKGDFYDQGSQVCAIVGGVMTQEIIKTALQKEAPLNNLFLLNPWSYRGKIFRLGH